MRFSIATMRSLLFSSSLPLHHHLDPHHQLSLLFSNPWHSRKPLLNSLVKLTSLRSAVRSHFSMPINGADRPAEVARGLPGEIHVIIGPMFAGKTTALLRRVQCEVDKGR